MPQSHKDTTILIAGGGIGGLTAAVGLQNAGFKSEVFESQPEFSALGVAVIIAPNGLRALRSLGNGIFDRLVAAGRPVNKTGPFRILATDGQSVGERDVDKINFEAEYGYSSIIVRRRDLHAILRDALEPSTLHAGKTILGLVDSGASVTAKFTDGSEATGDALIGADGLNSVVRQVLHGKHEPHYTGWGNLRGLSKGFRMPEGCPEGLAIVDGEDHVLNVPVDDDTIYFSCAFEAPVDTWPRDANAAWERAKGSIEGWYFVDDVVSGCLRETLVAREIRDHLPIDHWTVGRTTLLGDAAHAMSNFWGQGANSAIEDGIILARVLDEADDMPLGLLAYERARIGRTTLLQIASSQVDAHVTDHRKFVDFAYGYDAAVASLTPAESEFTGVIEVRQADQAYVGEK